jgi:hypothetical protein
LTNEEHSKPHYEVSSENFLLYRTLRERTNKKKKKEILEQTSMYNGADIHDRDAIPNKESREGSK